jgi:nickel-dependent lactate racemase
VEIKLTKNVSGNLEIESPEFLRIYEPKRFEGKGLSDTDIDRSIRAPTGTVPLSEMARGCNKVLIVTDDNTRQTPLDRILPPILGELKTAGVPDGGITFLIGLGTHRPMNDEEIRLKFGSDIVGNYRIVNHAWNNPGSLVSIGSCELGFEVIINKLAQDTDLLISVGSIVPHATAGFSGGGKSIMPGICGERTLEDTHWMALKYSMAEILGVHDNPIREAINSICRKVKLRLIVNTIMSDEDRIHGIVAGDHETAHRRGIEICKEVYGVPIHEKAEIVIAEAYPTDIDLRQAIKAICSADLVCRNGGVVILPAECPEGVSPQFPEFAKYGFSDPEKLFNDVEQGNFPLKLMAYTLVAIGRIISNRIRAILVTPNISKSQTEEMGFLWAGDLQSALDMALGMVGRDGKVAIMRQAGELLPLVNSIQ